MKQFFFLQLPAKGRKDKQQEHQALVTLYGPTGNTTEGSEFLDDAIRTVDQPLISVAEGYDQDW